MIYLDHNAGAPLLPEVAELLAGSFSAYGNPSSSHQVGRAARKRLDGARETVARHFGCLPREVVFTGSGSEAAAIAVIGGWLARRDVKRTGVVTSTIEHPCVLGAVSRLERDGARVTRVPVGTDGRVPLEAIAAALTPDVALCSLMAVNNETGVVQPAAEVARLCATTGIVFHTDAVQAVGRMPATLREFPADLLTCSAHKLGGPAGVGVLLNRRGVDVAALTPGHQENGRRGGTQNAPYAEALALALTLSTRAVEADSTRLAALRDRFEAAVRAQLPEVVINGGAAPRVGSTSNLCFPSVDGEALLIALDLEGICVSSGAACASGSLSPSHVLTAMGLTSTQAQASLRFSFGPGTNSAEVDTVVAALARLVPATKRDDAH